MKNSLTPIRRYIDMGNNHNDKFPFFEAIVLLVGIIAVTILVGYME